VDFCNQHVWVSAEALPPSLVVEGRISTIDVQAGELGNPFLNRL